MNGTILFIAAMVALSGCANKEKYNLATHRTTVAMLMYSDLQETRQVEAQAKETVAMASMGFVEKGCGNECDKPERVKRGKAQDCSKILEKYDKNCDSAKTEPSIEAVCEDLHSALELEKKRCEEGAAGSQGDEGGPLGENNSSTKTVKVDQSQSGGEVKKAIAKATADSVGSTVINNFIGDSNTSGSYNPSASGDGSVVMGSGTNGNASPLDIEAASILSLAGKDVESDAKEVSEGYFKPAIDTAKAIAWPVAAAYAIGEGFGSAGDKNSNNPQYDLSDNSTNTNIAPAPIAEEVLE